MQLAWRSWVSEMQSAVLGFLRGWNNIFGIGLRA